MTRFRNWSIKYKIGLAVALTASIGLTIATTAYISYDQIQQRKVLAKEMLTLAKVTALRSGVALSFRDRKNAKSNINALGIRPNTTLACIYDHDGELFVEAALNGSNKECAATRQFDLQKMVWLQGGYLEVIQSIDRNGQPIGLLFIQLELSELTERLFRQISIGFATMLFSLFIAFVMTSRMQRWIYMPIVKLGEAASRIRAQRDYSIRAKVEGGDEIGKTIFTFNSMLDQIQRDKDSLDTAQRQLIQKNDELLFALEEATLARKEVSEFTSMIGHELRTPIAVLQGEVELLLDGMAEANEQSLGSLLEEILHLNTLIEDMFALALSDSRALKFELRALLVSELLTSCIQRFSAQFSEKGIKLSLALAALDGKVVNVDPTRLKQVFDNVLKNSLAYTDGSGELQIEAKYLADIIVIEFNDSAPGVPENALDKLCKRFYRVDESRSRSTGGSGLGLSISKTIIEGLGGEFELSHSPLGGVGVRITLPLLADCDTEE